MNNRRAALGKTTRPSLTGILPRKRLFKLLDEGRESPAIWVSGPPGCGKTTTVASYLDHAHITCLWYQLDEGDADVATFFYFLGMAAAELRGGGEALPLLTPEYQRGLAVFTRRYFQQLYSRMRAPFAIVFDGCHDVPAFSPFHEVLREALAQLPPGGSAILISRGDPPAAFARLRANRALATVGWDGLRLTQEEMRSIALQRRPGLSEEALDELYARTQGWAAGLVLMLEQAKMLGSFTREIDSARQAGDFAAGQLVFDYLAGEIFQKSDSRTQDFLLRTAYLTSVTADMARTLTDVEDAGVILDELHRNNYFVMQRQRHPQPVYQYHPMLREFLRARAGDAYSRERRRQLQKASAVLLEGAGSIEEAMDLYSDSHEWDDMARVIAAQAEAMTAQGRGETLRRWIEELPPETQARNPWTVYWAAASQVQLAPREARLLYAKAFDLFQAEESRDRIGEILAASGALDAILYELDDFSLMDRWIAVVDEALKGGIEFPSPSVEGRVLCSMFTAATLRQSHRPELAGWLDRALVASGNISDPNLRMSIGLLAALTLMWGGLNAKALEIIESMRRLSQKPGVSPFSLTTLKNIEAMFAMLTADRAGSVEAMREGLEIMRATGAQIWLFQIHINGYGAALGSQDLDAAHKLAREFEAQGRSAGRFDLVFYHHFRAWEAMLRRDTMLALREEKTALRMAVEVGCPYFEVLCRLALAEILSECGDERKGISHLQQLRPLVEAIMPNNRHLEFICQLGFGRLALEHGRTRTGLKALRRGLALGREHGFTHFLWWRPAAMASVCAHALEAGIEVDYVHDLIRKRRLVPESGPTPVESWPWMFRVRALGRFELLRDGEAIGGTGKAQKRPIELLKVLVAYGGERVSEAHVVEAMWPRIDGDSAHRSFTSTLHRLRKLLGEDKAVVLHDGRLTLDRRYFWVDAVAFDRLVDEIESTFRNARASLDARAVERLGDRLLDLYRGPLFAAEAEEAWHVQERERKRNRFVRAMTDIGRYWEEGGQWNRVLACYERCLEADPLAESFYRHLIVCYQLLERRAEAIEVFNRCRKVLSALDVEPSEETRLLYEKVAAR